MMPEPGRIFIRLVFLIVLCFAWAFCPAEPLWEDSAFKPDVRSMVSFSHLGYNDTYDVRVPFVKGPGFNHPFQNWRVFSSSVLEAFSPGERSMSLFQYSYRDSSVDYSAEANFFAGYDYRAEDPGNYGFLYKGLRVNSQVNDRVRFRANWWNGRFYGNKDASHASPLIDGFNNQNQNKELLDNLNGEISYSGKHLTAAMGRGKFQINNSISGSIVLSDRVNEYDYLLLEERFGDFRFSFLHGTLAADTLAIDNTLPEKYLALHQMSYFPSDRTELFIGETVVHGGRLDISYVLPAYFWRIGKYSIPRQDNLLIYAGANFKPMDNLTLYLNGALDELTYNKFFTDWWGNKYALQTGAAIQLPSLALVPDQHPRCALEFTAVRPWTYTHYTNVTLYSHDRLPLGYGKGSNLIDLSGEINLPLPACLHWDGRISLTWQGSEGNDWRLNYHDYFPADIVNTAEAHWLDGDVSFSCRVENALRWDIMAHHSFLIGHSSRLGEDPSHQIFGCWQASY